MIEVITVKDQDAMKGPRVPKPPDMVKETAVQYYTADLRLTYADYCRMPSGERYELVEGDLRKMTPAPSVFHQKVSGRIEKALRHWVENRDLGEVYDAPIDVVLSEHNVVQPDILYVSLERLGIIKEACIRGAPDLVIEILSPSTAELDQVTKRRIYGRYGVREFWIVDPDGHSIEVAAHNGRELATVQVYPLGTTLESPLLDGFRLKIDEVFR